MGKAIASGETPCGGRQRKKIANAIGAAEAYMKQTLKVIDLDKRETAKLNRLWEELHYVSRDALTLVDASLARFDVIWAAAGHPHGVFQLSPQQLEALASAGVSSRFVMVRGPEGQLYFREPALQATADQIAFANLMRGIHF